VPELESLKLPEILKSLSLKRNGLILMTGGMGSGKTTTLSAMLNYRNQRQNGHILTIEDPLEYTHESKKSLFSHRELDLDTKSYTAALRSALRESPDVIMIGEVRDQETMQAVLEIANSGILAIATLHARNTYQALQRIISFFPPERHRELYLDLSLSLNCVLSQRLVLDKNNMMLPVMEVLLNNNLIADLIAQGKTDQIKSAMENTTLDGIQLYDVELLKLYKAGLVSLEEALDQADSKVDMERQLNFG
jgi:twitching motility protein PilU